MGKKPKRMKEIARSLPLVFLKSMAGNFAQHILLRDNLIY